jgi:HAD superfamily hydrolase (TIGR01509 family)
LKNRQAIVFDMDGLMVDTEPLSHQVWAQLVSTFGHQLDDETYGRMIGRRGDASAQIAVNTYDLPLSVTELIVRKEALFDKVRANGVPVMPGLMALMEELARRGLPWAVATSSPSHHAQIILEQLGLSGVCQAVAAGNEVADGKPAPDLYLLAAERLGIPPENCLALEDSQPGAEAAAAAGMRVVAIPNGKTRDASFAVAHTVYRSLHDVVNNLDILLR